MLLAGNYFLLVAFLTPKKKIHKNPLLKFFWSHSDENTPPKKLLIVGFETLKTTFTYISRHLSMVGIYVFYVLNLFDKCFTHDQFFECTIFFAWPIFWFVNGLGSMCVAWWVKKFLWGELHVCPGNGIMAIMNPNCIMQIFARVNQHQYHILQDGWFVNRKHCIFIVFPSNG